MDPSVIAARYAAGAGGVATAGNIISTVLTNKANERLAERANQWSIQQWQRENAYNDPSAQMARLRAAGINPHLAYMEGGLMNEAANSPSVTSAAGLMRPPQVDPLAAAQIADLTASAELKRSQIPVNEQMVENLKTQTEKYKEETRLVSAQVTTEETKQELNRALGATEAQKLINLTTENNQMIESFSYRLDSLKSKASLDKQVAENYVKELNSRLAVNRATIKELLSRKDLNEQQRTNLEKTADQIDAVTRGIDIANDIKSETGKAEAYVNMISQGLGALSGAASVFKVFMPGKSTVSKTNVDGNGVVTGGSVTTSVNR